MKFTIVATALLGLLLSPALADYNEDTEGNQHSNGNTQSINIGNPNRQLYTKQVSVGGGYQTVTVNKQQRVATVQQDNSQGAWKTVVNYNSGVVATKMLGVCYISKVDSVLLPGFDVLCGLVDDILGLPGIIQTRREVILVPGNRVFNLGPYGQNVVDLCRGVPTYMTSRYNGPLSQFTNGACTSVNVLAVLGLQYCHEYGQGPVLETN